MARERTVDGIFTIAGAAFAPGTMQGTRGDMALAWGNKATTIRTDLIARIDAMEAHVERRAPRELASELDAIRRIVARHGLGPAITVVHALDTALARGERGPLVQGWLAILRDAVGCAQATAAAADTYAAACAVRLDG